MKPAKEGLERFRERLLAWFRRSRRDLPWRGTRDPYRIWVSEVMLQQTRVAAVLPYYRRFLARFPNVRALARARNEQLLRCWAGLGYYRRARNLRRAAKEIVARHGGRFPRDLDAALALPGIGRYSAAAILSMAYGAPLAVLDGNVARVLARLGAVRGDLRSPARWEKLQARAQELLAPDEAGVWNQAMMELGATVCTPRAPRCGACPVSRWCRAYALGIAEKLPARRKKQTTKNVRVAAAVLLDPRQRTLLVRPPSHDGAATLFSGMWQFPALEVAGEARAKLERHLRDRLALHDSSFAPLPLARHSVTFRRVTFVPFLVRVERLPRWPGARCVALHEVSHLAVSSATRKIAAVAGGVIR